MNIRGQTLGIAIVTSVIILIVGLMLVNFLKDEVTRGRNALSCSDAENISDGTKLLCLGLDTTVIYFMLIIFSLVIGGITSRFVT